MSFCISLFKDSNIINIEHYGIGEDVYEGTIKKDIFYPNGQEFMAKDSNVEHPFTITPSISLVVNCEIQEEIDEMWEKLPMDGKTEQCGWLSDKYGISWQIVPIVLKQIMQDKDAEKSKKIMKAILQMKKISIIDLKQAYELQ